MPWYTIYLDYKKGAWYYRQEILPSMHPPLNLQEVSEISKEVWSKPQEPL